MLTNVDHLHLVFGLSNAKCISYPITIICVTIWGWDICLYTMHREGKYSKSVLGNVASMCILSEVPPCLVHMW